VKNRNQAAMVSNSAIILSEIKNIELLFDFLEHEDVTVGVLSSQILTEVHSQDGRLLEKHIHGVIGE
jgi:hypothetical protein